MKACYKLITWHGAHLGGPALLDLWRKNIKLNSTNTSSTLWKTRPSILVTTDPGAGAQEFSAAFENFLTMWYMIVRLIDSVVLVSPVNIRLKKNSSRYLEPTRRLLYWWPRLWTRRRTSEPDCNREGERVNPIVTAKEYEWWTWVRTTETFQPTTSRR